MKKFLLALVLLCTAAPAVAQQNVLDTDSFAGTNGQNLSVYNANWIAWGSNQANQTQIESTPGGGNNGANARQGHTWTNDQWAELKVDATNTPVSFYTCVRTTSPTNILDGYCGGADSGNFSGFGYRIVRFTSNVPTSLVNTATALAANDVVNLQVVGTTLSLTVNGSVLLTTSDATYATGNQGIYLSTASAVRLGGTWRAGSVSGGAAPGCKGGLLLMHAGCELIAAARVHPGRNDDRRLETPTPLSR